MNHKDIINNILSSKTKSGKDIVKKPDHIGALRTLRDFDLTQDWIEQKDLTKYGKILGSYILQVYPEILPQNHDNYFGYPVYTGGFTPWSLKSAYNGYQTRYYEKEDRNSEVIYKEAEAHAKKLLPIADHFGAMQKRTLRGGKLPKSEIDRRIKESIKGSLDPQLGREIKRLSEKWKTTIYEYTLKPLKEQRNAAKLLLESINWKMPASPDRNDKQKYEEYTKLKESLKQCYKRGVIQDGGKGEWRDFILSADKSLQKSAENMATEESEAFVFKMADKLGGLVTGLEKSLLSVEEWNIKNQTPFESVMRFRFSNGSHFLLKNSIVPSFSKLGNFFYRYPTTFHDAYNAKGEKIPSPDEVNVKKAFLADVKEETKA